MTVWDLSRLRYTVRKLTGKFDINQLPDTSPGNGEVSIDNPPGVDDYINDFYLLDLPEQLRSLKLRDFYYFTTVPNCGTYSIPQSINMLEPPFYVDNYEVEWTQYPSSFYRLWPETSFIDRNLFFPNGILTNFSFTLTQSPIQQGTLVIGLTPNLSGNPSPLLETFTDTDQPIPLDVPTQQGFVNPGILTGNQGGTGSINYLTGEITLTYASPPPNGTTSSCHYHPYVASRPNNVLYYQQQLFLRAIPNDVYQCKVMSYVQPTVALNNLTNSGTFYPPLPPGQQRAQVPSQFAGDNISGSVSMSAEPLFQEWWQCIAYGAALKLLIEEGDYEEHDRLKVHFEDAKLRAQRKALKQLARQRIPTVYSEGSARTSVQFPLYPIY